MSDMGLHPDDAARIWSDISATIKAESAGNLVKFGYHAGQRASRRRVRALSVAVVALAGLALLLAARPL